MTKTDEKISHLKIDKIICSTLSYFKYSNITLKLGLLERRNLLQRMCYNMNEWKQVFAVLVFVDKYIYEQKPYCCG